MGVLKPTVAPAVHCASTKHALGRRNHCAPASRCASAPRALVCQNCYFWLGSSHFALPGLTMQSLPWTLLCCCDARHENSLAQHRGPALGSVSTQTNQCVHKQISVVSTQTSQWHLAHATFLWTTHFTQVFVDDTLHTNFLELLQWN